VAKLSASLLLLFVATAARAEWKVASTQTEASPARGLEHRHVVVENSNGGDRASLELAVFSAKSCRLRLVDQPSEPRFDLADVMRLGKYLAGVNGGYFDPNYAPVGLLICDGRVVAPLRKARLLSGILSVANGEVRLQRAAEFSRKSNVTEAVQAGPFLVDRAKTVPGLDDSRLARRTFVAVGAQNQIALGFCTQVSLAQLAAILAAPDVAGGLKVQRALNLDGGSSSAFWLADEGQPFSISEQKTVRDFIAVAPR
jgi:Phosphodiester glycosidase